MPICSQATREAEPRLAENVRRVRTQELARLCGHAFDDLPNRWRAPNDSGNLSSEYARVVRVARLVCGPEGLVLGVDRRLQLALAPMPLGHKGGLQDANDELL